MYINLMKALIVAGGWDTTSALDSTEVFSGGAWMTVGALPVAVSGSRGFTFGNSFYMTGVCLVFHCSATHNHELSGGLVDFAIRFRDEVWKYDADTQSWRDTGLKLHKPTYYHTVDIAEYCPGELFLFHEGGLLTSGINFYFNSD